MNLIRRSKLIQPPTTELKKHSDRYLQITAASAEFDSAIATLTMGAKRPAGFPVAPGDTQQIMRAPRQAELPQNDGSQIERRDIEQTLSAIEERKSPE